MRQFPFNKFQIRRRYKQWKIFYDKLERLVGKNSSILPEFPEKKFFGRFNPDVVQERQRKFQLVIIKLFF